MSAFVEIIFDNTDNRIPVSQSLSLPVYGSTEGIVHGSS